MTELATVPVRLGSRATSAAAPHTISMASADTPVVTRPTSLPTQCSNCHLKDLCLPCGMEEPDLERLDELRFGRRRVKAGEALYHAGERFQFVYAVRA